jgi:hypothetical protein
VLLRLLVEADFPQPLPPDAVCPRQPSRGAAGNGIWAPYFDASADTLATRFVTTESIVSGSPLEPVEPLAFLESIQRTPPDLFDAYTGPLEQPKPQHEPGEVGPTIERLKDAGVWRAFTRTDIRPGKVLVTCPLHADKTPSAVIFPWRFHCSACGISLSISDLIDQLT